MLLKLSSITLLTVFVDSSGATFQQIITWYTSVTSRQSCL